MYHKSLYLSSSAFIGQIRTYCALPNDGQCDNLVLQAACKKDVKPSKTKAEARKAELHIMEYRELGNTGLQVSVIGMGCEGFEEDNYEMAGKLFDEAERLGINYFDLYASDPESRRVVGEALKGRRDKFMLQGHICAAWKDGQYLRTRELPEVQRAFEDLFAALKTDYIDVGMIHFCDAEKDWDRIVQNGILDYAKRLKQEGRIRHIGLSSHNPLAALKAIETGEIEVLMFSVNPCYDLQPASEDPDPMWSDSSYEKELTNMDPDRQRLYETCQREGVGITVMKAFAGGELLTENKIAGVSLTVNQCIAYALSRPAAATGRRGRSPRRRPALLRKLFLSAALWARRLRRSAGFQKTDSGVFTSEITKERAHERKRDLQRAAGDP